MRVELVRSLAPPSSSRTWASAPHPSLPLLATASSDKTVRLYSLTSFTQVGNIGGGHKRSVRTCSWKPGSGPKNGWSVLATGSFDATAGVWRREEFGYAVGAGRGAQGSEEDGDDYGVERGNADDADEPDNLDFEFSLILEGHDSEVKSLAWSPSGTLLATCSRDKSVWVWEEIEEDNFETVAVLQEHDGDVKCVTWHPTEELLASSSYDNTVRLYREDIDDWTCVAVLSGHTSTVWWVDFEGADQSSLQKLTNGVKALSEQQKSVVDEHKLTGPRLLSTSDDQTIRIWRRVSSNSPAASKSQAVPSILRSHSIEEEWVQESILPQRHDRAIYSAAWSKKTGLIVSTGSDGKLIVYQERWKSDDVQKEPEAEQDKQQPPSMTEWVVVAEIDAAHDVFEVNHVCWAKRWDKSKRNEDEEVIISTGDDGEVKVWTLEED